MHGAKCFAGGVDDELFFIGRRLRLQGSAEGAPHGTELDAIAGKESAAAPDREPQHLF